MSQVIITQQENDNNYDNVTWTQNIVIGFTHLISHYLTPLNDYGFDFNCLFTQDNYCKRSNVVIVKKHALNRLSPNGITNDNAFHPDTETFLRQSMNYVGSKLKSLTSNGLSSFCINSRNKTASLNNRDISSKRSPCISYILNLQLIACTIVLCFYLMRDLRYIITNWKPGRGISIK